MEVVRQEGLVLLWNSGLFTGYNWKAHAPRHEEDNVNIDYI